MKQKPKTLKCDICKTNVTISNFNRHIPSCERLKKHKTKIISQYKKGISAKKLGIKYSIGFIKLSNYLKSLNIYRNKSDATRLASKLHPQKHSEETKKRISKARIKYLEENPDQVPYRLYHASKMSYPEKRFNKVLKNTGITGWIYNYPHGIYSYDFGFPLLKLDVEIDGSTHNQEKVLQIDKRRDEWSTEQGWRILRFTAKECHNNLKKCVDKLLETIQDIDPLYDLYDINDKWGKIKPKLMFRVEKKGNCKNCKKVFKLNYKGKIFCSRKCMGLNRNIKGKCKHCNKEFLLKRKGQIFCGRHCAGIINALKQRKPTRPPADQLIQEIKSANFCVVGRQYGVSDNAIRKWCRAYDIDLNIFKKQNIP